MQLEEVERFAISSAHQAGAVLAQSRGAGRVKSVSDGPEGLVTSADLASEDLIRSAILEEFPDHPILAEEDLKNRGLRSYALPAADYHGCLWIVDPLDGTANYARGSDRVAVSIAFAVDGVVQAGAVFAPFLGLTYSATLGGGARRNGEVLGHIRSVALDQAIVGTGLAHRRDKRNEEAARFQRLIMTCRDIRRTGCPSLDIADVASGALDAHTEDLAAWDMAAAGLIAREVGAEVLHLAPRPESCPEDLFGLGFLIAVPGLAAPLARALSY